MGHAMDWARDMPRQLGFIDWTGLILTPGHLINLHPQYGMAILLAAGASAAACSVIAAAEAKAFAFVGRGGGDGSMIQEKKSAPLGDDIEELGFLRHERAAQACQRARASGSSRSSWPSLSMI